ncbi:bifunctional 5,10-methylenetetrahydrofolate dehydrogenase/5,10-methenyltetrahydrofolate cyclohydrolase, partial [Candidatus Sumerlaeota bacterium]|nr:bifunctional 5,10-methylenetetrahydrofolate dehydrogenase/5,10-methenyltetrahydrofolate cyclohydrolase [Candidatus Sumerlaeota bacterium]
IIVGENPASQSYVRGKRKAAEEAGFHSELHELRADVSREELLGLIDRLNADGKIDGILCQLPLPKHLDETEVTLRILPEKDVDGFHPVNMGRLAIGLPGFVPCTPLGCRELLLRYEIPTAGRRAVVIGRSNIVGTPMSLLLARKGTGGDATVTICHSRTANLKEECLRADIIVAAIGKPRLVTADMVKPGAAVIDVGINRIEDAKSKTGHRLVGDVDYESVREVAGALTPVPGGVGPMTIAMLLRNTLEAWKNSVR